ncbi:IPT/TIG domain-containing protein [Bacteroides thetaiotaomicron]|nr:IPT/TIG domain-containing protein [Bacteroides thetaiotaomicron]
MKMKSNTKSCCQHIQWMMLTFIALCIISCKDDDKMSVAAFDPSKPVVISDFTPKEGGAYQKIVIYGENFGADPSLVKVNIGGKDATIISTQGTSLYCFVPSGAFSGEIKVSVGEGENVQVATASTSFVYQKRWLSERYAVIEIIMMIKVGKMAHLKLVQVSVMMDF